MGQRLRKIIDLGVCYRAGFYQFLQVCIFAPVLPKRQRIYILVDASVIQLKMYTSFSSQDCESYAVCCIDKLCHTLGLGSGNLNQIYVRILHRGMQNLVGRDY